MDVVAAALAHVRARSAGPPVAAAHRVTLNFHADTVVGGVTTIAALARDGVYRSQFETGISNGGLTAYPGGDRWRWESRIFGGAYDGCAGAGLSLRPKYGALNFRGDRYGGSRRFGACHVRLRPAVMGRTTFCFPDSHAEPVQFGCGERMGLIAAAEAAALDVLDNYIEAHVHGAVQLGADAEAVVLDPCYRGTAVAAAARRLACAVEWHPGFRLDLGMLDACARYRPGVARALAAMGRDGVVTPREIGAARAAGVDPQLTKWAWHCVARFGAGA